MTYQYRNYKASGDMVQELYGDNPVLKYLGMGVYGPVSQDKLSGVVASFEKVNDEVPFTDTMKTIDSISWNPSITVKESVGDSDMTRDLFSFGIKLSMSRCGETEVGNGYSVLGDSKTASDSSSVISTIVQQGKQTECNDIFNYALLGIGECIADNFVSIVGTVKDTIKNKAASIAGSISSAFDWNVIISGKKSAISKNSEIQSISVLTALASEAENVTEYVAANTVGEAYLVYVEDADGREIQDLSDNPLTLSLEYTDEELKAANMSPDNVGNLAIYRYDEEHDVLCYTGGEVDTENKKVTAVINQSGEYVLVFDGAAPEVTEFAVSDSSSTPVITAMIKDISDIRNINVVVDGKVVVNESDFIDYYNKHTGQFIYRVTDELEAGVHTVSFRVTDSSGNTNTDAKFSFIVTNAPEISDIVIPDSIDLVNDKAVSISVSAKTLTDVDADNEIESVTAKVTATEKNGHSYQLEKALALNDGVWSGSIEAEIDVSQYDIQILAVDVQGGSVYSEMRTCTVNCSHKEIIEKAIKATCTSDGITEGRYCSVCGEVFAKQKRIPALSHGWDSVYTVDRKADFDESGLKSIHCKRCDASKNHIVIPRLAALELSRTSYTYDGTEKKPEVKIQDENGDVVDSSGYSVTYVDNINAGTATVIIKGIGDYTGTVKKTFTISKASNSITASGFTKNASTKSRTFSIGAKAKSKIVSYKSDNKNITVNSVGKVTIAANYYGKAAIVIKAGSSNYKTATKTIIVTVNRVDNTITASNVTKTFSDKAQSFNIGAARKGSGKITYSSNNSKVTVSSTGKVTIKRKFIGKASITIKVAAAGIYKAAARTITVTVNPTKTSITSVSSVTGLKMMVKWKKNTVGTGFEIQYSTSRNFDKGNKTVKVTSNSATSKTITGLTKRKTYYVRIRTYKTVSGKKYYSGWSSAKSVTIK
ncbi:MAG: hypothetical protein MR966_07895 [Lachnospiraceae bacterium]|nr:hypothetical protein [Lachnospiraceae bacterium]